MLINLVFMFLIKEMIFERTKGISERTKPISERTKPISERTDVVRNQRLELLKSSFSNKISRIEHISSNLAKVE